MTSQPGRVLHTGALAAFARGSLYIAALLRLAVDAGVILAVPTGALAQAWAGSPGERYRLDYLMQAALPVPLSDQAARQVGELLAAAGSDDVTAGHSVHLGISQSWPVLTDDGHRLRSLHSGVEADDVP